MSWNNVGKAGKHTHSWPHHTAGHTTQLATPHSWPLRNQQPAESMWVIGGGGERVLKVNELHQEGSDGASGSVRMMGAAGVLVRATDAVATKQHRGTTSKNKGGKV